MEDIKKKSRSKYIKNSTLDILTSSVIHDLCNQFTVFGASVDSLIDNCDKSFNESIITSIDEVRDYISSLLHSFLGYLKDSSMMNLNEFSTDEQMRIIVKILNFRNKVSIDIQSDDAINLKKITKPEYSSLVLNLVSNAIDAARSVENPKIKIESYVNDGYYVIKVSDNGKGLPRYYNKIFKPFFTTKGSQGTGLGLFNSKMIVEKYNGEIKASRLKVGSLFCIKIPL